MGNIVGCHPPIAATSGRLEPQELHLPLEAAESRRCPLGLGSHLPPSRQTNCVNSPPTPNEDPPCVGDSRDTQAEEQDSDLSQAARSPSS